MFEVKKVKAAEIFPLIRDVLENGQSTKLTVSGDSMYPFLRDGIDSVEMMKAVYSRVSRGDIVLIKRTDGGYVMHRIIRKENNCFYIIGDAQQWIEGPLNPEQLIAVVPAVWRKDKRICCSSIRWRLLSEIWLYLRPFRSLIIKNYSKVRKMQLKLFKVT